jgi:hypothetical protein
MTANSVVLSRTDTVVVTATGGKRRSDNQKTGDMLQIQAAPTATDPVTAGKTDAQALVCFDCPVKPWCYVNRGHAPLATWKATKGSEPISPAAWRAFARDKPARLGSWGDPAAMSADILQMVVENRAYTGYTHQWRHRPDLSELCMASVETVAQREEASALGWRTFRPIVPGSEPDTGEVLCPYVSHGVQCADCLLCCGNGRQAVDVVVPIHGTFQTAGTEYLQNVR